MRQPRTTAAVIGALALLAVVAAAPATTRSTGVACVRASRVCRADTTAVLHTNPDDPFDDPKVGPAVRVEFADRHVGAVAVDNAKVAIHASTQALAAARSAAGT